MNIEKILVAELAKENEIEADIVVPVPDSWKCSSSWVCSTFKDEL